MAARLMMAITTPASAAFPVVSVTKGGTNRATKAENPAPMAKLEIIHHSKAGPLALWVSLVLAFAIFTQPPSSQDQVQRTCEVRCT
jgi:hypothetical protein